MTLSARAAVIVATALFGPGVGGARLPAQQLGVGAQAIGTATSGASAARGVQAFSASPARLAWNEHGITEIALPSGGMRLGLRPISPGDVAQYSGKLLPADVREAWLRRIESAGSQDGATSILLVPLAVARGRFAFQFTTTGEVAAALNPDAAEGLLFGNVGRSGQPAQLDFERSSAEAWAVSTLAVGGGFAVPALSSRTGGRWGIGFAAKLSFGHLFWSALDSGSGTSTDPLAIRGVLPVVATSSGSINGMGAGVDIGVTWQTEPWTFDLVLRDVVNTFAWRKDDLEFRRGVLAINPDSTFDRSETLAFALAPVALQANATEFGFRRSATLSVARSVGDGGLATVELHCGPSVLEGDGSGSIGATVRDEDFGRCRAGASFERTYGAVAARGGVSTGSVGTDVGLGLSWSRRLGSLDLAYGRRFGSFRATALALGATVRVGT